MLLIDPATLLPQAFYGYLQSAVVPRPIALASTVDAQGHVNLSPYSFFNVFGSNPPILAFSPVVRSRDQSQKDTLHNLQQVGEVVIHTVTYEMVEQVSLASAEYAPTVNEFEKAGFTPVPSVRIKPPRVAESPVSFECKVTRIIPTGTKGGAGNLVLCEVVLAHVREDVLDADGHIDPRKLDAVGRMGGRYYCRTHAPALFEVPRPGRPAGMGFDQLPLEIRHSKVLTGNQLARLASCPSLPDAVTLQRWHEDPAWQQELRHKLGKTPSAAQRHAVAARYLDRMEVEKAWAVLLSGA